MSLPIDILDIFLLLKTKHYEHAMNFISQCVVVMCILSTLQSLFDFL